MHLLRVALDVAQHVVAVEVARELVHHVITVAHVDERPAAGSVSLVMKWFGWVCARRTWSCLS